MQRTLFHVLLLLPACLAAQSPVIHSVTPVSTVVDQYGKFEATIDLTAGWTNPYDYDDIQVKAAFTGPNGAVETVDGFFIRDYEISNTQTGGITPTDNGVFKIRFSPTQPGNWQYSVACTNSAGTAGTQPQAFQCVVSGIAINKGFIRNDQTNYLHFDNGAPYVPIGENMAWQDNTLLLDYQNWLSKLTANGGNYIRVWQTFWGFGLEWTNNGFEGLRKYKQDNAFYLDWLLDYCADHGVYVMLCLNHHGQVSSQVDANWNDSPYNATNGGPCQHTWEFFTNQSARSAIKNRLRYTVARWGYQRSVLAWELFNEIDWTDNFNQYQNDVTAWHGEMSGFLKQQDVRRHLVTTSYAYESDGAQTWNLPDIDFTQTHYYLDNPNLQEVLENASRHYLSAYDKPTLNGEFGLSGSPDDLPTKDPVGIHVHNCIWGGLFSGAIGGASQWWWDSYVESQNLYTHFAAPAALSAVIPFRQKDFRPVVASVQHAPAELDLSTTLGWSELADTSFIINADGSVSPYGAGLGQFLYGSSWNTQYRRPPVFYVHYPQNGPFSVNTAGYAGQSPKIAIWVDGNLMLETDAAINQTYTVNVPAGAHTIKVDNTGTDWIMVADYAFGGLGSGVDAFALRPADHTGLTAWIHNKQYNHLYIKQNGAPNAVQGASLVVDSIASGGYHAKWYNCLTGNLVADSSVTVSNGSLNLAIPDLVWDAVLVLDQQSASITELAQNLAFRVFPNPVSTGVVHLEFDARQGGAANISLLDASGQTIGSLFQGILPEGRQLLQFTLAGNLPTGLYWIRIQADTRTGVQAIAIAKP